MPEIPLLALLAAVTLLLALTVRLWRQERRRAERLAAELEAERARRSGGALPPLKAVIETVSRLREEGLGGVLKSSFEELAGWAREAEPELRRLAARDGTLTILFSDIENSTTLNHELGDKAWVKVLGAHDEIVRKRVAEHNGYVVKSQGDGFMVAFGSAAEAVRAAVGVQRRLASAPRRLRGTPIQVRIGVHTGPALERGGDLFGRNVALAARVAAQARGGEVLVSEATRAALADEDGDLPALAGSREVELKGLPGRHAVHRVEWREAPQGED